MRVSSTALAAAVALAAIGCSDSPSEVSTEEAAVLQAYADVDPGYLDEDPGGEGLELSPALTATGTVFAAPGDPYVAPERWGRRRAHERPSRDRRVVVEGDTARVAVAVHFRGVLLVDSTHDGVANPGAKRMHETLQQRAVFVKDTEARRGWRLIGISLGNVVDTDPARRTVEVASVAVEVNGQQLGEVTDPGQIFRVGNGIPELRVGDSVVVTAQVRNATGTDLVPPTQVFLHLRHHRANTDAWGRILMHLNDDGSWTMGWRVRRAGIARMAVDAIDSEALQTQSGDNYRANIWAFPYRAIP